MLLNNATKQCERALAVLECAFTNIIGFQGNMHFETRATKNELTGDQIPWNTNLPSLILRHPLFFGIFNKSGTASTGEAK